MSKPTSAFFVDPLYSRMADDLHLGGMSQRTHDGYLRAVRQLADYCKTAPDQDHRRSIATLLSPSQEREDSSPTARCA